jgi:magnesium chelatase subunit H
MDKQAEHLNFVYVTMDGGHNSALHQAARLMQERHGIRVKLALHSMASLRDDAAWQKLASDVDQADFVFGCMIFGEDHVRPLEAILKQTETPKLFITSNPALIYKTHIGKLDLSTREKNPGKHAPEAEADDDAEADENPGLFKRWLQKLRPAKSAKAERKRQTALTMNLTKIMKYLPGKMRDLHTFISAHDYWMHSSPENLYRMMGVFIERYVPGYQGQVGVHEAVKYPEGAIYHPDAPAPFEDAAAYRAWRKAQGQPIDAANGHVGVLIHRAIILSENTAHLDALIRKLEAQGMEARTVYSALLDFRPSMQKYLSGADDLPPVDVLMNGMGFPLVGGPAGARPEDAIAALQKTDVGYFDLIPLGFQRVEDWRADNSGLNPMQVAMNVALPELDGTAEPIVYGGPTVAGEKFIANAHELDLAARRVARRVRLKQTANADKKIGVVLFNFPPNLGNAGTAAFLDVFSSLHRLLHELRDQGYSVEIPESADALRRMVAEGNALQYGTTGNVGDRLSVDDYRRLFPWYHEIEQYWGHAPGDLLTDGRDFYILGAHFGNVFVAMQPGFGYERDPMRLLMGKNASPHHGFAAFYTWLDQVYDADAVVHLGTHGALEFMPGKQVGLTADCWPVRLLGGLPNFYYYCVNNPSEGSIAKRRSAATLVSYMVPPLQQAGLYKGLRRLKDSIEQYHKHSDPELVADIRAQAQQLGIEPDNDNTSDDYITALNHELLQVEQRMIPLGLHVLGEAPVEAELIDILALAVAFNPPQEPTTSRKLPVLPALIASGLGADYGQLQATLRTDSSAQQTWATVERILRESITLFIRAPRQPELDVRAVESYLHEQAAIQPGLLVKLWAWLDDLLYRLTHDQEVHGLLHSLEGGYILPSPGNDVVRNDKIVPTGRNMHALDPYRIPTAAAIKGAQTLVDKLLQRLAADDNGDLPETVAMVLWGTDNLKSDGEGIAQCLYLLGARPLEDELGNISDVELIPLAELGRPRIDIVVTISGIFRDLFHHQSGLIDKAVRLAASADEPLEQNYVRMHTLEHAATLSASFEEAASRVFCNESGQYGASVNYMVESGNWEDDSELSDIFMTRKSFAYRDGGWQGARAVMERSLSTVGAAFQNIDSFEMGISDVEHYYEYLGGVTKSVQKLNGGKRPPVMVADAISLEERLSSLEQMVRLESRAKLLNPKWYDAMLEHGYEGVSEIHQRVDNTYGWSATADAVEGWVYDDVANTFILDDEMRQRMAAANPHATSGIVGRLLEAQSRGFWDADETMIERLRDAYGDLEDRLEGVGV